MHVRVCESMSAQNSSLLRADKCISCVLFIRTVSLFAVCRFFAESTQRGWLPRGANVLTVTARHSLKQGDLN